MSVGYLQGLPNNPPFVAQVQCREVMLPHVQLITGTVIKYIQDNSARNPILDYLYKVASVNGYNNPLVHGMVDLATTMLDQVSMGDPNILMGNILSVVEGVCTGAAAQQFLTQPNITSQGTELVKSLRDLASSYERSLASACTYKGVNMTQQYLPPNGYPAQYVQQGAPGQQMYVQPGFVPAPQGYYHPQQMPQMMVPGQPGMMIAPPGMMPGQPMMAPNAPQYYQQPRPGMPSFGGSPYHNPIGTGGYGGPIPQQTGFGGPSVGPRAGDVTRIPTSQANQQLFGQPPANSNMVLPGQPYQAPLPPMPVLNPNQPVTVPTQQPTGWVLMPRNRAMRTEDKKPLPEFYDYTNRVPVAMLDGKGFIIADEYPFSEETPVKLEQHETQHFLPKRTAEAKYGDTRALNDVLNQTVDRLSIEEAMADITAKEDPEISKDIASVLRKKLSDRTIIINNPVDGSQFDNPHTAVNQALIKATGVNVLSTKQPVIATILKPSEFMITQANRGIVNGLYETPESMARFLNFFVKLRECIEYYDWRKYDILLTNYINRVLPSMTGILDISIDSFAADIMELDKILTKEYEGINRFLDRQAKHIGRTVFKPMSGAIYNRTMDQQCLPEVEDAFYLVSTTQYIFLPIESSKFPLSVRGDVGLVTKSTNGRLYDLLNDFVDDNLDTPVLDTKLVTLDGDQLTVFKSDFGTALAMTRLV